MATGGIKEYIFLIAGVIYVLAMFPALLIYQNNPADTFTTTSNILLVSEGGCFLLMAQLLVGAFTAPKRKKDF